jgi:hypothetical protein
MKKLFTIGSAASTVGFSEQMKHNTMFDARL